MPATKNREIRDSKRIGTVNKRAVKTAVQKVAKGNSHKVSASHKTAPVLRRKK